MKKNFRIKEKHFNNDNTVDWVVENELDPDNQYLLKNVYPKSMGFEKVRK